MHYDDRAQAVTEYRFGPQSPFEHAVAFYCANIARGEQGAQPNTTGYDVDELIAHVNESSARCQALPVAWKIPA